jgi:hypothetical protein
MNCPAKIFATACLLLYSLINLQVAAQQPDTSRLTATFRSANMEQFARTIEEKTTFRVYFDPKQTDSLVFDFSVNDMSLSEILNRALLSNGFTYAIDRRKNIFITKNRVIATRLVPGSYLKSITKKEKSSPIFDTVGSRSSVEAVQTLASVTVSAATNLKSTQMGVQNIDIKAIRQVPVVFGEADVLRVVMSLPGVKTVGEASTGLNVRGGSTDQNLILFNDATIYNPSHFFGMFSAFNPDMVKEVTLYKGNIPARYGGRLASVLEIAGKEGNTKNITGSAGLGPVTSRITIEGPLIKDKSSFIAGVRSTYANWLLKLLPQEYENSKAAFSDFNLTLKHSFDNTSELLVTGYLSHDRFSLNRDTVFKYSNRNLSIKWRKRISRRLTTALTGGIDDYNYDVSSSSNPVSAYKLKFRINQKYLKAHFTSYITDRHTAEFGIHSILYNVSPGSLEPQGSESLISPNSIDNDRALESAVYINDKFDISNQLTLEAGLRYSVFNYLGPQSVNFYKPGAPKELDNILDSVRYGDGRFIKTYGGPEVRISMRYLLSEKYSIKAGFNTNRQYIHMLSNTAAMAPTDIWKLSDPNIAPQTGTQYSIGLYRNFKSNTIETSVELYYKAINNYLDYKSGANLVMNHHIETDVISTKGTAYGAELHVKKMAGKFNGWFSYTFSRILLRQDDPAAGEVINEGREYPANYDKPHDVTFIGNYRISQRFSVSLNTTYSTGRPITVPIGRYYFSNSYRTLYGRRNEHRIPDYFRADFSMNIEGNHKVKQKTHNSWTIGVYNFTARKNPYSVYYISENGMINGYRLSIFGTAIPFVTYNIRF